MTHPLLDMLRVTSTFPSDLDLIDPFPRPAFGLIMPARLPCGYCRNRILAHIFYDLDAGRLSCRMCTRVLSELEPDRFLAITVDARGLLPGIDHLPAGQAIAVLVRFGAVLDRIEY